MLTVIDAKTLTELCDQARMSPRRRAHLNLHPTLADPVQRLVVAMEPDSYIRPHRHTEPDKWELFNVIQGQFKACIFDQQGQVLEIQRLAATGDQARLIETPAGCWHCVLALEPDSVFMEVKQGPYIPFTDKDFADWAPAEQAAGVSEFMDWLRQAEVGDRFI